MSEKRSEAVEVAGPDEMAELVDTLVLAFGSDPLMRWLFPTPHEYVQYFPEFVERYGGEAFAEGTAYHVDDFSGAAIWLAPEATPDEDEFVDFMLDVLPEEKQAEAWSTFEAIEEYQPDEPFWYLPFIGVEPTRRRDGCGSALMEYALERCDRSGHVAYLESANPTNLSLYLRYDFELLGVIQSGSMPPMFPMVREPQS